MFRNPLFILGALALIACEESRPDAEATPADSGVAQTDAAAGPPDATVRRPQYESQRNNLRFKGGARLKLDWSRILALEPDALCREIENFDCLDFVHVIALGGVDAYQAGINEPFAQTPVSAPMIVERVALNACSRRWEADLEAPNSAEIFKEIIELERLDDPASGDAFVVRLFNRTFLREPEPRELAEFQSLYVAIAERSQTPVADWGKLVCFSTLTSVESLFY